MDFKLTEEQELLLESVDDLMEQFGTEAYFKQCDEEHRWPKEFTDALLDAGFQTLGVDEKFGGTPVDVQTLMLVSERICRRGAPIYVYGNLCALKDMTEYGTPEQQEKILAYASKGIKSYTLGFTEPQAGSDNSGMTTRATHVDGKVYIDGHKTFNTGATVAPYMMCIAREYENENPYKDMSWYLVPLDAPGVKISVLDKIGCHCMPTCEVYLDHVELDESALVGTKGKGFYQLMKNFELERLFTCVSNVGMAMCAYNDALAYAGTRKQFGKNIGDFQIIQQKLCDMKIKCDNMYNMLLRCAWKKQNGEQLGVDASLLKRYTGKAAFEVIDDAMQVMGGIGYTNDCRIARLWRDQRGARIYAGTEEVMVHSSARALIKNGPSSFCK